MPPNAKALFKGGGAHNSGQVTGLSLCSANYLLSLVSAESPVHAISFPDRHKAPPIIVSGQNYRTQFPEY
jgi:hypothetical protein